MIEAGLMIVAGGIVGAAIGFGLMSVYLLSGLPETRLGKRIAVLA